LDQAEKWEKDTEQVEMDAVAIRIFALARSDPLAAIHV
jgi:hypothetical protein